MNKEIFKFIKKKDYLWLFIFILVSYQIYIKHGILLSIVIFCFFIKSIADNIVERIQSKTMDDIITILGNQ